MCGIRLIFDHQHHTCINPNGMTHEDAAIAVLNTWPDDCRPKIHFSSPRIEPREIRRIDKETGKRRAFEAAPLLSQHADYIDASTFVDWARKVRAGGGREFDVMCEAKAKDLAVIKLREELRALGGEFVVE
jgi:UV DNA damage endonuclease